MSSTGDRQRWSDERQRFDDVQRRVRSDAGPQTRWSDPGSLGRGWSRFAEGEEVAKRHVRLGRRVVLHLLTQPVTEHDRGVLKVSGTGEEELPSRHRVVPAGDPDLVSAARCRMPSGPSKPASVELMSDGTWSVMAVQGGRYRVGVPIFPRDMSDMPKKRGDRAQKTAEKRARRERRQLARDEKAREEHVRLVVERSHDPRFTQRIHRHDGTIVYQWPVRVYRRAGEPAQHLGARSYRQSGVAPS